MLSRGDRPSNRILQTSSVIGISTRWLPARARAERAVVAPSATPDSFASAAVVCFAAADSDAERVVARVVRERRDDEVAHSRKAGEGERVGVEREAEPGDFGKPAVSRAALALMPRPMPSAMPAAIAMTFFKAAPSSTPTTSPCE